MGLVIALTLGFMAAFVTGYQAFFNPKPQISWHGAKEVIKSLVLITGGIFFMLIMFVAIFSCVLGIVVLIDNGNVYKDELAESHVYSSLVYVDNDKPLWVGTTSDGQTEEFSFPHSYVKINDDADTFEIKVEIWEGKSDLSGILNKYMFVSVPSNIPISYVPNEDAYKQYTESGADE